MGWTVDYRAGRGRFRQASLRRALCDMNEINGMTDSISCFVKELGGLMLRAVMGGMAAESG